VVGGELRRVDDPEHLVEVAARRHRIDEHELDLLVGPDDEDVADRLVVGGRALGRIAVDTCGQHAAELGDVEVRVADQRVVQRVALGLLDVLCPLGVVLDGSTESPMIFTPRRANSGSSAIAMCEVSCR